MTETNEIAVPPLKAAALTGRNRDRIFRAIRDRELIARKDGKATLIEIEELRRWVKTMPVIGTEAA